MAIGKPIPISGNAIVDLDSAEFPNPESDHGKKLIEGFEEFFQIKYFDDEKDMREAIGNGDIDIIISRNRKILEIAVEERITYFSTCPSAEAAIEAIKSEGESNCIEAIGDRKKKQAQWGFS
jgi:carbamoyl-phosphate synthase large subunit